MRRSVCLFLGYFSTSEALTEGIGVMSLSRRSLLPARCMKSAARALSESRDSIAWKILACSPAVRRMYSSAEPPPNLIERMWLGKACIR